MSHNNYQFLPDQQWLLVNPGSGSESFEVIECIDEQTDIAKQPNNQHITKVIADSPNAHSLGHSLGYHYVPSPDFLRAFNEYHSMRVSQESNRAGGGGPIPGVAAAPSLGNTNIHPNAAGGGPIPGVAAAPSIGNTNIHPNAAGGGPIGNTNAQSHPYASTNDGPSPGVATAGGGGGGRDGFQPTNGAPPLLGPDIAQMLHDIREIVGAPQRLEVAQTISGYVGKVILDRLLDFGFFHDQILYYPWNRRETTRFFYSRSTRREIVARVIFLLYGNAQQCRFHHNEEAMATGVEPDFINGHDKEVIMRLTVPEVLDFQHRW